MVDELPVECLHRAEGCEYTAQRQLLASHLKDTCLYTSVPCPKDDCAQQVLRKDLAKHSAEECIHRLVPCSECDADVSLADLEVHSFLFASFVSLTYLLSVTRTYTSGPSCLLSALQRGSCHEDEFLSFPPHSLPARIPWLSLHRPILSDHQSPERLCLRSDLGLFLYV